MSKRKLRDFLQIADYNIQHNIKRPLMGLGAPGIGKSEGMKAVAVAHNMPIVDFRLLLFSETDLKGLPYPDEETHTTTWLPNKLFPTLEKNGPRGILLLEELTSAPKKVQAAAYQLLQDYKMGEYEVPEGWFIFALGNGEDDDGVFVQMPSPLANRMQIQELECDLESWKEDFAFKYGVNSNVIAYLNFKPTALHTQEPGKNSMLFASPRSWTAVSDVLNSAEDISSPLIRWQVEGNIGDVETASFYSFLKFENQLPKVADIISGKVKNPPEDNSLKYLLISSLVSHFGFLATKAEQPDNWEKELVTVVNYLSAMPPEFFGIGLRDLIMLDRTFMKDFIAAEVDTPEILKFIKENTYLFK